MYSIKLIEQARKEMEGRDLVSRAVRIELSSVQDDMMKDNSRDITLVQGGGGRHHLLTMTMGGNERLATKKGKRVK